MSNVISYQKTLLKIQDSYLQTVDKNPEIMDYEIGYPLSKVESTVRSVLNYSGTLINPESYLPGNYLGCEITTLVHTDFIKTTYKRKPIQFSPNNSNGLPYFEDDSFDVGMSIAAQHHYRSEVRQVIFAETYRCVKGTYIYADVIKNSFVAKFLDEFVGEHNGIGHIAYYFTPEEETKTLSDLGWDVKYEVMNYPWEFDSLESMAKFCKGFFGLFEISDDFFIENVFNYLPKFEGNGKVGFYWQLGLFVCNKT